MRDCLGSAIWRNVMSVGMHTQVLEGMTRLTLSDLIGQVLQERSTGLDVMELEDPLKDLKDYVSSRRNGWKDAQMMGVTYDLIFLRVPIDHCGR
jgi:hypothetical protein